MLIIIEGPDGSGKTTLVDNVLGILSPTKGKIAWHNNIRKRGFGYIPQNIYLLDDSIRNNIAIGEQDYQIDDNESKFRSNQIISRECLYNSSISTRIFLGKNKLLMIK